MDTVVELFEHMQQVGGRVGVQTRGEVGRRRGRARYRQNHDLLAT